MIIERNKRLGVPKLNTASLPDLIFTVLFFFMIVTHMRKVTLKVKYRVPQGTELTRLVKKSAVSYIYIGYPSRQGSSPRKTMVQVNDKLATPAEITDYMSGEKSRMSPEDRERMTVSVKADRNTKMSVITDVKMALRRANIRRISYSAEKRK